MKRWRVVAAGCALIALVASPATANRGVSWVEIHRNDVGGSNAAVAAPEPTQSPAIHCEGTAPEYASCTGSMVLTGDFVIRLGLGFEFRGFLILRGFTETGATTVVCDFVVRGPPCSVTYEGEYVEGQTWTMVVAVPARGYWRVTVS